MFNSIAMQPKLPNVVRMVNDTATPKLYCSAFSGKINSFAGDSCKPKVTVKKKITKVTYNRPFSSMERLPWYPGDYIKVMDEDEDDDDKE